jgi:hypothetical protein
MIFSCACVTQNEESLGETREIKNRWDRLLLHCVPLMGHYSRMGAQNL